MSITRVLETPRVTKPYTDEIWADVLSMGEEVDRHLSDMDVRLTMGGEPTFVAVRDRDAAEWNTDALGPTKRAYAVALMDRLRERYGASGFVHIGQGKWYPGEQLPRWAMSLYWRADGEPCWLDPSRFADERDPGRYNAEDAQRFIGHLADTLSLDRKYIQPGYEDTLYYLWRERRLPVNTDPFDARLDDELDRARLRRVFDAGLSAVTGYALPLTRAGGERGGGVDHDADNETRGGANNSANNGTNNSANNSTNSEQPKTAHWTSGPWFFRDERMYLIPGDSPMGYRLPLDSLPWVAPTDYPWQHPHDPFGPAAPLRTAVQLRLQYEAGAQPDAPRYGPSSVSARDGIGIGNDALAPRPCAAARRIRRIHPAHGALRRSARSGARRRPEGRIRRVRQRPARCCTCSCRRSLCWTTTWTCSPRSKPPRASCA